MKDGLRTLWSALLILVGGLLIVLWAVSGVAVTAVEDGTAAYGIAEQALDNPAVIEELGEQAADSAVAALDARGVDLDRFGLELALRLAIEQAVASDAFRDALLVQVASVQEQVAVALTDALRTPGPLTVEIDVSGYVNAAVDGIPVVGASVPDVALTPLEIEAVDQQTFETVRTSYAVISWLAVWGVWCGIALIVVGMFVTRRLRWFLAKTGLAVAAFAGGGWLVLHLWGVDALARSVPGQGGAVGELLTRILTEEAVPLVESRLAAVAIWAAVAALVMFLVGVLTLPRGDRR